MKQSDIDETKIRIIINNTVRLMLALTKHGYTFDSVELLPYPSKYGREDEGFAYRVWAKDEKGEKIVAYNDIISMHMCEGEPGSVTKDDLKQWDEDVKNGKYDRNSPNYWAKQESTA